MRRSLSGRSALVLATAAIIAAAGAALAARFFRSTLLIALIGVLIAAPAILWLARRFTRPWTRIVHAV